MTLSFTFFNAVTEAGINATRRSSGYDSRNTPTVNNGDSGGCAAVNRYVSAEPETASCVISQPFPRGKQSVTGSKPATGEEGIGHDRWRPAIGQWQHVAE